MPLNDREILQYMEQGYFVQNGIKDKQYAGDLSLGLSSAGYDITLGSVIKVPKSDYAIDLTKKDAIKDIKYDVYNLGEGETYILSPYEFACASSQGFKMPTDVVGIVYNKSTNIRNGISVSTTVIEPGWYGDLTIEIFNMSKIYYLIGAGTPIAQIMFYKINEPLNAYNGRYNGQEPCTMALPIGFSDELKAETGIPVSELVQVVEMQSYIEKLDEFVQDITDSTDSTNFEIKKVRTLGTLAIEVELYNANFEHAKLFIVLQVDKEKEEIFIRREKDEDYYLTKNQKIQKFLTYCLVQFMIKFEEIKQKKRIKVK
jgi:dCTP deaminase